MGGRTGAGAPRQAGRATLAGASAHSAFTKPFPTTSTVRFESAADATRVNQTVESEPGGFFSQAEPLAVTMAKRQAQNDLDNLPDLMDAHALWSGADRIGADAQAQSAEPGNVERHPVRRPPEIRTEILERETGFEPAIVCVGSPELVSVAA
jgi:hypothetical protein